MLDEASEQAQHKHEQAVLEPGLEHYFGSACSVGSSGQTDSATGPDQAA